MLNFLLLVCMLIPAPPGGSVVLTGVSSEYNKGDTYTPTVSWVVPSRQRPGVYLEIQVTDDYVGGVWQSFTNTGLQSLPVGLTGCQNLPDVTVSGWRANDDDNSTYTNFRIRACLLYVDANGDAVWAYSDWIQYDVPR